jgi:hypothetical protein
MVDFDQVEREEIELELSIIGSSPKGSTFGLARSRFHIVSNTGLSDFSVAILTMPDA